jgi:hypothetical protein
LDRQESGSQADGESGGAAEASANRNLKEKILSEDLKTTT